MTLRVLGHITDPGRAGKANEDGFGARGAFAWIIDGATGLGDEPLLPQAQSDAAWLTAVLGEALEAGAEEADDPMTLLTGAARIAEARFNAERVRAPKERYEIPTAAVLLAHFEDGAVEIVDLGDCAIYLEAPDGPHRYGGTEAGRALEKANAQRHMAGGGGRTGAVVEMLRAVRSTANTPEGYPIFAPDAESVARARRSRHAGHSGAALLLTDGFEAAIEDYGLHTSQSLLDAARTDLAAPLEALRAVERADPDCTRFPRFKPSDDATALLVSHGAPQ